MTKRILPSLLFAFGLLFLIGVPAKDARAACSSPPGVAGEQIYNVDENVMQYCNGDEWVGWYAQGNEEPSYTCTGESWNSYSTPTASWLGIGFGGGKFIATATDTMMVSSDGENWSMHATPDVDAGWKSLAYGNGAYVAVATIPGSLLKIARSTDGATWTTHFSPEDNYWNSVTFGNGLFVAVAYNGAGSNRVMTSPDGITWTARVAAENNSWQSVTYGNGLFVAVAASGTNRVMTSPDGITWTARTAAEANVWMSVTYGDGKFVAVANSGTNRVMTSADGISWSSHAAAEANNWYSLTYGGGLFVAVSTNGTNRIMTSSDGESWTARAATEANVWAGIAYGDGKFVAASSNGTNRVMVSECAEEEAPPSGEVCTEPLSVELDNFDTAGNFYEVHGDDNYIYVSDGANLYAFTFDGNSFNQEGVVTTINRDVWTDGTYIYSGKDGDGITVYSFDGSNFTELDSFDTPGYAVDIWGDGDYIYVADLSGGLAAFSFNGTDLTLENTYTAISGVRAVWGDGTYIYVADETDGVVALTFNGSSFSQAGITALWFASGITGDGEYIYVTSGNGLYIYSFNGSSFTELFNNSYYPDTYKIWAGDTYVYVGGLGAITFDGTNIDVVANISYNDGIWDDGTYVYIVESFNGLFAYPAGGCVRLGDNLGDHLATEDLNMSGNRINASTRLRFTPQPGGEPFGLSEGGLSYGPDAFVVVYESQINDDGTTDTEVLIDMGTGTFNYDLDWEDSLGNTGSATGLTGDYTISGVEPGTVTVAITGTFPHFGGNSNDNGISDILQWGTNPWQSMASSFSNESMLVEISAADEPDLSNITSLSYMFGYASYFNADISGWDISNITNMEGLFAGTSFNHDISSWDMSGVTSMEEMFYHAYDFNQNISAWNVSNVTNMTGMFDNASSFNQDLSGWCVTNIGSEPGAFDDNTSAWTGGTATRPQWGTCP